MEPNPAMRRLDLSRTDRAVIIHADDIGMCHATIAGLSDLLAAGTVSSAAVMVPCPWFPAAAAFAREHPEADFGVHLTLTSEWSIYRWPPVSTADPGSGLLDEQGYLHATAGAVQERGDSAAVGRELEAQMRRAIGAGMMPTHADTHMGAVAHAKYMESYVTLALRNGLPPMVPRLDEHGARALLQEHRGARLDDSGVRRLLELTRGLEERGVPLLDRITGLSLSADPASRMDQAKAALSALGPGITHFIIHPARETPELRALDQSWGCRDADWRVFCTEELRRYVADLGIHLIGYRALQKLLPRA